jgi:putative SOS response-associated peptidase YedK
MVHDRMPVIVQPKDYQRWLDPENEDVSDILATAASRRVDRLSRKPADR